MSMLGTNRAVDTVLILNKRGDLALDMQPGGYAFLNFKERAPKWVFIKSTSFPNAFSIRPANNIEFALTYDQKRNAAVVKECKMGQAHAMQFWGVSERDTLFTIMDSSKHLNVDKLPQKVGARAYLTNTGAGYLSSSSDDDGETVLVSPSMADAYRPQKPRKTSYKQYQQKNFNANEHHYVNQQHYNSFDPSNNNNSLINELITNHEHDRDFSRRLESEFGRIKRSDELKQISRRRAAVLQSKLDDFTNKKSKEAKYWLQAYRKICGENPNTKGAEMLAKIVQETKIVGAANKKEDDEIQKAMKLGNNMEDEVADALEQKLTLQNDEEAVFESKSGIEAVKGSEPPVMSTPKLQMRNVKMVNVGRGRSSTRNSALIKRSDSLESIRSNRSVARHRDMFEDIADRQSVVSHTSRVRVNRRAVKEGITNWNMALNQEHEWDREGIERAKKTAELEEQIKQLGARLRQSNKVLAELSL